MRLPILICSVVIVVTGCLRKDVLDQNIENGNFQETQFYTSGDFDLNFDLEIQKKEIIQINDTLCRPYVTFKMDPVYAGRLDQNWEDKVLVKFYTDNFFNSSNYSLAPDFSSPFVHQYRLIRCGTPTSLTTNIRLELIDPNNGRVSAYTEKEYSISF